MTKILLVEDDKSLREIYGVRLLAEGYDIVSAGDGEEALAIAIKERPQLILSDVMMPKISGFDMLDILRSTTETKNIKVIIMTALSSEDQRQRGESLGADLYLVKSQVGIEDVVKAVKDVLNTPVGATPRPSTTPVSDPTTQNPDMHQVNSAPTVNQANTPSATMPTPQTTTAMPAANSNPAPTPAPAPAPLSTTGRASSLPRPTAPFSTPRPSNLGERIIQPIKNPQPNSFDVARAMDEALKSEPTQVTRSDQVVSPSSSAPPSFLNDDSEFNPYLDQNPTLPISPTDQTPSSTSLPPQNPNQPGVR